MWYANKDINWPNLQVKKGDILPPNWQSGAAKQCIIGKLGKSAIKYKDKSALGRKDLGNGDKTTAGLGRTA